VRVGFVGVGNMGGAMAANALAAGHGLDLPATKLTREAIARVLTADLA
jgi:3-hydroxyisobutyrate dehydrogenase-like beta-hydroxyacid dehydrogenase